MSEKFVVCIIPARLEAQRLPGKLLEKIGDYTVIQRTYMQAKKSRVLSDVVVATNSTDISRDIVAVGGRAVMVDDPSIINGTQRVFHALPAYLSSVNKSLDQVDAVVNVQGDEPFVSPDHINVLVRALLDEDDGGAQVSSLVSPLRNAADINNPSVVKCVMKRVCGKEYVLYCSRACIPSSKSGDGYTSDGGSVCIPMFRALGLYAYTPRALDLYMSLEDTIAQKQEDLEQLKFLENGFDIRIGVVEGAEHGVDTQKDLADLRARYL